MSTWFSKDVVPEMGKEDYDFRFTSEPVLGFLSDKTKAVVVAYRYEDEDEVYWKTNDSEQWNVTSSLKYWCELPSDPV